MPLAYSRSVLNVENARTGGSRYCVNEFSASSTDAASDGVDALAPRTIEYILRLSTKSFAKLLQSGAIEVYRFFPRQTCQAAAKIGKIDKASKLLGELSYRIRERVFVLLFSYT